MQSFFPEPYTLIKKKIPASGERRGNLAHLIEIKGEKSRPYNKVTYCDSEIITIIILKQIDSI